MPWNILEIADQKIIGKNPPPFQLRLHLVGGTSFMGRPRRPADGFVILACDDGNIAINILHIAAVEVIFDKVKE